MRRVVKHVAAGRPIRTIARELNVPESTIHNWKRDNVLFQLELEKELRALEELTTDELRIAAPKAISNAHRLLHCDSDVVGLGASRLILDKLETLVKRRDLQQEVDQLREKYAALLEQLDAKQGVGV